LNHLQASTPSQQPCLERFQTNLLTELRCPRTDSPERITLLKLRFNEWWVWEAVSPALYLYSGQRREDVTSSVTLMPISCCNLPMTALCSLFLAFLPSITTSVEAEQPWVEVVPSLGAAVDIASIRKVNHEYAARLRWKVLNPNIDIYRDLNLPLNAYSIALEHIACTAQGPISYEVEHWYQTPNGRTLHHRILSLKEQSLSLAREKKWLAETATPWSQILSPYGSDSRSFVCAYVTAKCSKQKFRWPLHNLTPLDGPVDRLKTLNQAHTAQFIPACSKSIHGSL
jgi:hypothetical protein